MNALYIKDCPHLNKDNLINIEKFKLLYYNKLKCEKCDEYKNLLICLICGESFCSQNINNHYYLHNKENKGHIIYINITNLNVICLECKEKQKNYNGDGNQEIYIESTLFDEYINIIKKFKYEEYDDIIDNSIYKTKDKICSHIKEEDIINDFDEKHINDIKIFLNYDSFMDYKENNLYLCLCLSCGEEFKNIFDLEEHYEFMKHKLYINFIDWTIICEECESKYKLELMNYRKKYRVIFQLLKEKKLNTSKKLNGLTKEEIYETKYEKIIKLFVNKKVSKILFMVGAGISTSAGIPDFRSKNGLFKQLQDKYKLSSPQKFFKKDTFLKNPEYFYDFAKLFDLSKIKPTISHMFMNFFVKKNMVKYIFTQNIDGLEKKAKIPDDKIIYAHGNFYTGHCAECNIPIDIEKINEGIKKKQVYYCPLCFGPCKPNIVFYGEKLPSKFFDKISELKENNDIDLIIIMGTSLKVVPFSKIPKLFNPNVYKVVFNKDEVGNFNYQKLTDASIFIKGMTDFNVIQFND